MSSERRVERETGSGSVLDNDAEDEELGRVRAWAMLQAFAPKSRT